MHLTLRLQGNNENAILAGLDQIAQEIRARKTHTGQAQMAVGEVGWTGHWAFEAPAPVPNPARRGMIAAKADEAVARQNHA